MRVRARIVGDQAKSVALAFGSEVEPGIFEIYFANVDELERFCKSIRRSGGDIEVIESVFVK